MSVARDPRTIETAEPFVSVFEIQPDKKALIRKSLQERGYLKDKPVVGWRDAYGEKGRTVLVEGHTRLMLAIELNLPEIMVTLRRFESEDEALTFTIQEQAERRNISQAQLVMFVLTALAKLDTGQRGQGARNDLGGRTAKQLAEMLGVTSRTIERARQLIGFGDDDLLAQVKAGELSLNKAIEEGQRRDAQHARATTPPAPEPEAEPEPEPTTPEPDEHEPEPDSDDEPEDTDDPQATIRAQELNAGITELFETYGHELTLEVGLRVLRLTDRHFGGGDYIGYMGMRDLLLAFGERYASAKDGA